MSAVVDECVVMTKRSTRACKQYLLADLACGLLFASWIASGGAIVPGVATVLATVVVLYMRHRWWRAEDARLQAFDRMLEERRQLHDALSEIARTAGICAADGWTPPYGSTPP